MRKVFLDNLPRWKSGEKVKAAKINWEKSIGYEIHFTYDSIDGCIEIVDYNKKTRNLTIKYENYHEFKIYQGNFSKCALGSYLNNIVISAPWMIKYFTGGYKEAIQYTKTSGQRIYPICPDCGRVKNKSRLISDIYNKKSIGCSCGDGISYPNKLMFNVLEQLQACFETEYSPDWIKPKAYDFNIQSISKIIEMDGGLGHGKKVHSRSKSTKEETLEIDEYKNEIANKHGIKVIRIDSKISELEYIKTNILNSELAKLFDLSNINWNKAEEFALSNLIKKACEYKRDNPRITTTKIGELMNLDRHTIRNYLKKGNRIWSWFTYDEKEEIKNSAIKEKRMVEIFKNNISLGIFDSISELSRKSEEQYNVKLDFSAISRVCLGKLKHYKGFTFKYIDS